MSAIKLPVPPIGVKIFAAKPAWANAVRLFDGISFCHAVATATAGAEVWVEANSIKTCRWSPVILGFKSAESKFDHSLKPRLAAGTVGVYLAGLDRFRPDLTPDIVIARAEPETLRAMIETLGWDHAAWEAVEEQRLSRSALRRLRDQKPTWRSRLQAPVSKSLAAMRGAPGWTKLTTKVFKNRTVTKVFDRVIDRTMADMSICRNSVAIPLLTGKVNISYYCTGGITWGANSPRTMTSGWPWELWRQLQQKLGRPVR